VVEGEADELRVALLIENKITAASAPRQAERYQAEAARMRGIGWDKVWCILVALRGHVAESTGHDAFIDLEKVADLLRSDDPARLKYRRGIIAHALNKRAASGVKIADLAQHRMRTEYLEFSKDWSAAEGCPLNFPPVREKYYDGEDMIDDIRHPSLPGHVRLRHRLWTTMKRTEGQVDLVVSPADAAEQAHLRAAAPDGTVTAPIGEGVRVSIIVPEMRQAAGFDPAIAQAACAAMRDLVRWYPGARA
jgi:hypothetical protein